MADNYGINIYDKNECLNIPQRGLFRMEQYSKVISSDSEIRGDIA